jgi:hypothetical protein
MMSFRFGFLGFLFLSVLSVRAQDSTSLGSQSDQNKVQSAAKSSDISEKKNELFFHPIFTLLSLASDKIPLLLAVTYERHLEDGNSFIMQPQMMIGDFKSSNDVKVSVFNFGSLIGLRKYFNTGAYNGFYLQGSLGALVGSFSASQTGNPNKADAIMKTFAGFGYLGYKWTHVFFDIGGGYTLASGTLMFNNGNEVDLNTSGPGIDINLGFGF